MTKKSIDEYGPQAIKQDEYTTFLLKVKTNVYVLQKELQDNH